MKNNYMLTAKKITTKSILIFFVVIYIIPLYVAVTNAFKPYAEIIKSPLALPHSPTLSNFTRALKEVEIFKLYANSIIITGGSLLLIILLSTMLAYVFARKNTKLTRFLYGLVLVGMMIPIQSILIPSIKTLQVLHLMSTSLGLACFYAGSYMSIAMFLYTEFIRTIPLSLEESAMLDGASPFRIFFQIVFPLVKTCSATVIIFVGMWIWNDFLPPMYILGSSRGKTITTGIYNAIGTYTTDWSLVFACVIFASLPIVVLYLFMQKQFQRGMTAGSIK